MHSTSKGTVASIGSRELLLRTAGSPQLQKSKRLRDLLLYLGDRGLNDPNCTLPEHEIGVDVLGRPPDYDTWDDTLVRVLLSQLRKNPHEHFAAEGRDEVEIIEIPKESYVPVLGPRPDDFPALVRMATSGIQCFRCFFMRSLHYLNGGTLSPFPAEPEHFQLPRLWVCNLPLVA